MGSQISFWHTEDDTIMLLHEIERNNGKIIIKGIEYRPCDAMEIVLSQMSSFECKFPVVCSQQSGSEKCGQEDTIFAGTAIEFMNCCKGNSLSRTYEIGRLYISKTAQGIYAPQLHSLYKKISTYIKKNYYYSSSCKAYYSPDFKNGVDRHFLYPSRLGRIKQL